MPLTKNADSAGRGDRWLESWHVAPSVNRDYDFIDGLRGIAMLMVLAAHFFYVNPASGPAVRFIGSCFSAGSNGVTLFFALSGFLISWPFWKRKASGAEISVPSGYGWRRFWKIYPPLAFSVLVLAPIYILRSGDWSFAGIGAKWLAGIPFLSPITGEFNPVMWSLIIEVQFYVILPILFISLKKVPAGVCLWIIPLIFVAVPFVCRLLTGQSPEIHPTINVHFPTGLDCFCLGIFVAGLDTMGRLKAGDAIFGVFGVVFWILSLLAFSWCSFSNWNGFTANEITRDLLKFSAGCLLFFVAAPRHPAARIFCAPWLRWCGIISYEWYLLHQPIYGWIRQSVGPAGGNPLKYAAIVGSSFVLGLVAAALTYRFFSLPILRYGRGKKSAAHSNKEPLKQMPAPSSPNA
ncbi:MAG TPA: acyltransferase [Verrucomicrobiae bacterium]|jgi:peptidoglycan/LPS O-acetylase OafA/YrhL